MTRTVDDRACTVDDRACSDLVVAHEGLVEAIVSRVHRTTRGHVKRQQLVELAGEALRSAARDYQPSDGLFKTIAYYAICDALYGTLINDPQLPSRVLRRLCEVRERFQPPPVPRLFALRGYATARSGRSFHGRAASFG